MRGADKCGHERAEIHGLRFQRDGIRGERVLLDRVDIGSCTLGDRQNQRNADDADAPGKGCQESTAFFGKKVF